MDGEGVEGRELKEPSFVLMAKVNGIIPNTRTSIYLQMQWPAARWKPHRRICKLSSTRNCNWDCSGVCVVCVSLQVDARRCAGIKLEPSYLLYRISLATLQTSTSAAALVEPIPEQPQSALENYPPLSYKFLLCQFYIRWREFYVPPCGQTNPCVNEYNIYDGAKIS